GDQLYGDPDLMQENFEDMEYEDSTTTNISDIMPQTDKRCAEGPTEVPQGWEAYTYRFRLEANERLPPPFARPLCLRAYESSQALPRARQGFAALAHMRTLSYSVPEPLLFEEDCRFFGGPFILTPWLSGVTLLDRLKQQFTRIRLKVSEAFTFEVRPHHDN